MDHELLNRVTVNVSSGFFSAFVRSITWDACYLPHAIFQGELGLIGPLLALTVLGWWSFRVSFSGNMVIIPTAVPRQDFLFLCCWLLVPPVCMFLFSVARASTFTTKYVLFGSLALFFLFSGAIAVLQPGWRRNSATAAVVLLMAWHCLSEYRPFRPADYACGKWILENKAPTDRVMSSPPWFALEFLPKLFPDLTLELGHIEIVPPWVTVAKGETLWVIYSRPGWESELDGYERRLEERGFAVDRVRTVLSSHTFVYTSLCYHRLDPFFTVIYRIRSASGTDPGPVIAVGDVP